MSTPINDGGSAFPRAGQIAFGSDGRPLDPNAGWGWAENPVGGMSLRDWFAGQALAGILQYDATGLQVGHVPKRIASDCFAIADAMIAAREVKS